MDKTPNMVPPTAPIPPQEPYNQTPPPAPQQPKKKGKGCLIAIAIVVLLMIIGAVFSDDDQESYTDNSNSVADSTAVISDEVIAKEQVSFVDSSKVNELKPFFNEEVDEKGITWVLPKSRPEYINMNGICTYFCIDEYGKPSNLRFLIQYYADEFLFIDSYTFIIDGNSYDFSNPNVEMGDDRKFDGDLDYMVWEWSDTGVAQNDQVVQILDAIKNAKEVKIRFNDNFIEGEEYKEKTLTQKDIKAITQPIEYFEALGGSLIAQPGSDTEDQESLGLFGELLSVW